MSHRPPVDLRAVFKESNPIAVDLLSKMLVFNPTKRCTVAEALRHPWLKGYRDPESEPVAPAPFRCEFDVPGCTPPTCEGVQRLIHTEVMDVKASSQLKHYEELAPRAKTPSKGTHESSTLSAGSAHSLDDSETVHSSAVDSQATTQERDPRKYAATTTPSMIVTTPRDTEPPPPSEGGAVPPQFVRETNRRLEQLEAQLSSVRGDVADKVTAAVMKVLDQEIEHISVRLRRADEVVEGLSQVDCRGDVKRRRGAEEIEVRSWRSGAGEGREREVREA